MKILAIDSTAQTASVAVIDGDNIICSYSVTAGLNHSETLLPMVEHALSMAQMDIDEMDIFAVAAGPGSFTGVRIGVSLLKGLAFGKQKACIGVSTLEALANNLLGFEGVICPCMDARRSQVYNAIFECDGKRITRLTEDRAISLEALSKELSIYAEEGRKIYFCGDGYSLAKEYLSFSTEDTPSVLRSQNACSVALVALKNITDAPDEDYSDKSLKPAYLRVPQAERERLERLNK